ncbi:MAG: FAD-binding oxidoreductase [Acidimicrobiia bacterium]|nr:FAD-binding oxidoreductase [Acidimicrobiia bacterium]MDX2466016.1 FAD-binding oxidoreductase [Acidimicrobiia bacterium]
MLKQQLARLGKGLFEEAIPGAPQVDYTIAPNSAEEAAEVLRFASEHSLRVLFWGGGTHQAMGHWVDPDLVMTTSRLDQVVDWQPEDLTVVVQPGVLVADLEAQLEQQGQTAVLPETPGVATVGGTIAAGLSGWRRLRYGPTRDRMLEVKLATGDGRLIRGGGRLVKNVTGYDLPRLATGSLGSLGLITEVCLKLWPLRAERAMLHVDDPERALQAAYRPDALIETNDSTTLYLAGSAEEIAAQAEHVGGDLAPGHRWPEPLAGRTEIALRVPASAVTVFSAMLRTREVAFQAAHGTGEVRFLADGIVDEIAAIRRSAESMGGALVVVRAGADSSIDPWGTPPGSVELQSRVKDAFDPVGVANPGILPGGI